MQRATKPPSPRTGFSGPCGTKYGGRELKKAETQYPMRHGTKLAFYTYMRVTGPFDVNLRSGIKLLAAGPFACEKSSGSSALDQQPRNFNAEEQQPALPVRVELVCQDETPRFDPFWDGPRLLPAFVAQLMGQAGMERRNTSMSVETAYGRARYPRQALLLDRKS
jgi:hypothetical protein